MSVAIRSLTNGTPVRDQTQPAPPTDSFNLLPTEDEVYNLYTAPANGENQSVIVRNIRLTNIDPTNTVKVTVWFNRPDAMGNHRRIRISPEDLPLPPGFAYLEDGEITLEPGDSIQAKADRAKAIQFLISGIEREVV